MKDDKNDRTIQVKFTMREIKYTLGFHITSM